MRSVTVVPCDPNWIVEFEIASSRLRDLIGENLLAIHHIGSTSIPGIHAKPVIDMLAVVTDLAALDKAAPRIESVGYVAKGEFGIGGRRYFRRDNAAGVRTHQVHAFESGSPHIDRHLVFRDYLRAHPLSARQYSDLKQRLAVAHPHDIDAYMDGKDGLIKQLEADAVAWAAQSR